MDPQPFAAEILRASAPGYAAAAASLLLERHPEVAAHFGQEAMESWKAHLTQRIRELAAALTVGEVGLFLRDVAWARRAFAARQVPEADLYSSLLCLRDALAERLPEALRDHAVLLLQRAIQSFSQPVADPEGELDADDPHGRLALSYLLAVLEGDKKRGVELILGAVDGGMSVREAYLEVLMPAQREVGRMWHENRLDVDEEHFVTGITRELASLLVQRVRPAQPAGRTLVAAAVAGNVHDIGLQAVADFFEMEGWQSVYLGGDVPAEEIARAARRHRADMVVLSAAMSTHLAAVEETVRAIREAAGSGVRILVGGRAFDGTPGLGRRLGADGQAGSPGEAVALAAQLPGPDAGPGGPEPGAEGS